MNFYFQKFRPDPSIYQKVNAKVHSKKLVHQNNACRNMLLKISNKHSFSDKSCLHQFRRVSQVINDPSPDVKQFPDVKKKNMSVCVNPRIEKYKIHLDMIENQNPIQIPHLSIKAPQKYPPILSSKILPSTKRYKTDISEGTQIYKISNHFTIQSVRDKQQKLVKNIQSLIEHVNSSRDEKLCKLFDKLKHDLDLDDIKLENE